jgi:alpha-D-ribose 1-methylphosphonate 5-triphosphate diphosphatase
MWLSNLKLVLSDQILESASLKIEAGVITDITEGKAPRASFDGRGFTALPGLVDVHGDMLEREIEPRPTVHLPYDIALFELDKRLASSGITTAFAAVSFAEPRGNVGHSIRAEERANAIIETVHRLRPYLLVDMRVHARFEITNERAAPVLKSLISNNDVHLVSMTDHTPGQGQYRDLESYVAHFAKSRQASHDEVRQLVLERMERAKNSPPSWNVISEVAGLARAHNIPLASHDDDTLEKVELMVGTGATISEFPITLETARTAKANHQWTVMGAPNALRGKSYSGNLSAREALEHHVLDVLCSDYHPASMLQCAYLLPKLGLCSFIEAVKLVSENAATSVGLYDRGVLEVGKRADLVLVEEHPDLPPRVRATLREGQFIFSDHTFSTQPQLERV